MAELSFYELIEGVCKYDKRVLDKYQVTEHEGKLRVPTNKALIGALNDLIGDPVMECLQEQGLKSKVMKLIKPEKRRQILNSVIGAAAGLSGLALTGSALLGNKGWFDLDKYNNSVGRTFYYSQLITLSTGSVLNTYCLKRLVDEYADLSQLRLELRESEDSSLDDILSERQSVQYRSKAIAKINTTANLLNTVLTSYISLSGLENLFNGVINSQSIASNLLLTKYNLDNIIQYSSFSIKDFKGVLELYELNKVRDASLNKIYLFTAASTMALLIGTIINNPSTLTDLGMIFNLLSMGSALITQLTIISSINQKALNKKALGRLEFT